MSPIELLIFKDSQEIARRTLEPGTYSVGRSDDNDIVLADQRVSRRHATLRVEDDGAMFQDQNSSNGLRFKGLRVCSQWVGQGQSMEIGPFRLEVRQTPAEDADATVLLRPEPRGVAGPGRGDRLLIRLPLGAAQRQEYALPAGTYLVGRSPECEVVIKDPATSRRHAELVVDEGGAVIKDLGSTSGTYVQGRKVESAPLAPGLVVKLGPVSLEVVEVPAGGEPRTGPRPAPEHPLVQEDHGPQPRSRRGLWLSLGVGALVAAALAGGAWWYSRSSVRPVGPLFSAMEQPAAPAAPAPANSLTTSPPATTPPTTAPPTTTPPASQESPQARLERETLLNTVKQLLDQAREELAQSHHPAAMKHLDQVLRLQPDHAQARQLMGQVQAAAERAAAERQRQAEERRKTQEALQGLLGQGREALAARQYDKVRDLASQALRLDGGSPAARELLKKSTEAKQEEAQRREAAEREAARQVEAVKRLYDQGLQLSQKGQGAEALRLWERAVQSDPKGASPYTAKARQNAQQLRRDLQTQADALHSKGEAARAAGKTAEAMGLFRQAQHAAPWHQPSARALAELGRENAAKVDELYKEGVVRENYGDVERAVAAWRQALALSGGEGETARKCKERLKKHER